MPPVRQAGPSHRRHAPLRRRVNREHAPAPPATRPVPARNLMATRRPAGQRPARAPPAKPACCQPSPPGTKWPQGSRLTEARGSAPHHRPNPAEPRTLAVPRHHRLTGATRSSARPASRGAPRRAGPVTPRCTGRLSRASLPPGSSPASQTYRPSDLHHVPDVRRWAWQDRTASPGSSRQPGRGRPDRRRGTHRAGAATRAAAPRRRDRPVRGRRLRVLGRGKRPPARRTGRHLPRHR
jgi:hypothetical protein